jgi:radical SAM protein with 4Fe4S-binding SPASM domain
MDYTRQDFDQSPMVVFYEVTRACDLLCKHCRASAQPHSDPCELSGATARAMIDNLARFPKPPLLVLTGGDPLKRGDVFDLVEHAVARGIVVAMTPSATPLVTADAIRRLHESELHRLAVSLDGCDAVTHDGFRRVAGSFAQTLWIVAEARRIGLPVQINTTVARHNLHQIDALAELIGGLDVALWSVFFLVPTGRAQVEQRITAEECETVFERLWHHQRRQSYPIKTTEAPHYRRFVLQNVKGSGTRGAGRLPSFGTNDGKGVMFVSHTGEIYPSGFLPIRCGRFPQDSVVDVYQKESLFRALRDADQLKGKCGVCEFKEICGGSRSRSYALTGDPLAAEPDCAYVPPRWDAHSSASGDATPVEPFVSHAAGAGLRQ